MPDSVKPQLSASAALLLPDEESTMRCAEYSRELAVDAGGTAIDVSAIALVDVPLPWPKPVFDHPFLSTIQQRFQTPSGPGRVLATVPEAGNKTVPEAGNKTVPEAGNKTVPEAGDQAVSESHRVVLYERHGGSARCSAHVVGNATELGELFSQLADGGAEASSYATAAPTWSNATLVCTQGSHDVCCGTEGVRLADRLRANNPEHQIFRVSHTGGHRFAPTAMTLPDGRMWAGANAEFVLGIHDRSIAAVDAASRCRGWWGAKARWAQMAERAVFAQVGWAWNDLDRSVEVISEDDRTAECVVTSGGRSWDVVVALAREVPTIACRAEGGLPAKPGREYGIRSLIERER